MRRKLNRKMIVEEAFTLLNQGGLDTVSTRRLAANLNVQSPALYWHFKNKQELLMAMRETLIESSINALKPYSAWQEWLFDIAITTRKILLEHRQSSNILAIAPFTERAKNELIPAFYIPLIRDGVNEHLAKETIAIMSSFTMGWIVYEQNEVMHNYVSNLLDMEQSYISGVNTIISGLEQKIGKTDSGR